MSDQQAAAGTIVILNGAPRSGKSSIAAAIQERFAGIWLNLGVDAWHHVMPPHLRPGFGLRPGGERPDLAALVPVLIAAFYDSVAAHSRLGLNVVVDAGHHGEDASGRPILALCAERLRGLPALLVGVRCPIEVIMDRRRAGQTGRESTYLSAAVDEPIPAPVLRWQQAVHDPGIYDLEFDTATTTPDACAMAIARLIETGLPNPTALQRLAGWGG